MDYYVVIFFINLIILCTCIIKGYRTHDTRESRAHDLLLGESEIRGIAYNASTHSSGKKTSKTTARKKGLHIKEPRTDHEVKRIQPPLEEAQPLSHAILYLYFN